MTPIPTPLYSFTYHLKTNDKIWQPGVSTDKALWETILAYQKSTDKPMFKTSADTGDVGEYNEKVKTEMANQVHGGIAKTSNGDDVSAKCE
jgi:hypothetical protein